MNIFIIHGDDGSKSYNRLKEYIDRAHSNGWEVIRVTDKATNISEVVASKGLFEADRLVVIDNANLLIKKYADWLKKNNETIAANIVVYKDSALTKTFIATLPTPKKIEEFKLPFLVWKFLDSFYPGNARVSLKLLHEVTQTQAAEFVFTLLAKLMRDLYWVSIEPVGMDYPAWRIGKLKSQASKFKKGLIKQIIEEMVDIDVKVKTSKAELLSSLDLLIVSKLELNR